MSVSFESVRRNASVHRLDLGLYSHLKEGCVFSFCFVFVCLFVVRFFFLGGGGAEGGGGWWSHNPF